MSHVEAHAGSHERGNSEAQTLTQLTLLASSNAIREEHSTVFPLSPFFFKEITARVLWGDQFKSQKWHHAVLNGWHSLVFPCWDCLQQMNHGSVWKQPPPPTWKGQPGVRTWVKFKNVSWNSDSSQSIYMLSKTPGVERNQRFRYVTKLTKIQSSSRVAWDFQVNLCIQPAKKQSRDWHPSEFLTYLL